MASPFAIATGDPQAVKIWSKLLMVAALQKTYYSKFSSTGTNMPVQVLQDLSRGPGDQIKYDLLSQMSGYGVSKNTQLIGDFPGGLSAGGEQNLVYFQDSINIEQKRLAHSWMRMSSQRTVHDLRKDASSNLTDRWAFIMDRYMFGHLIGITANIGGNANSPADDQALLTDINTTHGANPAVVQDAAHIYSAGAATAFTLDHISFSRWKAETVVDPAPIQKMTIDGQECFVMFIRPEQANNLQQDPDWLTANANGAVRGTQNPMFTGSIGMWNNVVIHVSTYMPKGSVTNALDNFGVLCGKQAATVAFGNAFDTLDQEKYGKEFIFSWVERDVTDYGMAKGVSAGAIFGIKRAVFNTNKSMGCIRVDSRDAAV
jgi:N4-gp56 family major capsid protein